MEIVKKAVQFPDLQVLMTRHGIHPLELARIMGITYSSLNNRLSRRRGSDFRAAEMKAAVELFSELEGRAVTVDELFFAWERKEAKG